MEAHHLASKEGLALLNGTQNMLAFFAWSVLKAQDLSKWADLIATMSLDPSTAESSRSSIPYTPFAPSWPDGDGRPYLRVAPGF